MENWCIRFFCRCGSGVPLEVSFANPWFFREELCPSCGARLQYSTSQHTVRKRGPFWRRRIEVHPDSEPLPVPAAGG